MMVNSPPGWNVMQDSQKSNNTLKRWSTHELDKMWCKTVRNSITPCEMTINSLAGWDVMWQGQKFNNTLQDDSQLTNWTKCDARWSGIQQHLARRWLTHCLDKMWCKMVRNSTTPCEMTVNSLSGQNVMQDGQKFNNTLQDDSQLTGWTKCDARWSEIHQHLARQQSTHWLDEMLCKMIRNSTTPCKMMVGSQTGQNVMWDGQKFNNTLWDNNQLTLWTKCDGRWSEIQQHLARRQLTHSLDKMWCEMVRNSTTPCKMTVNSLSGWNFTPHYSLLNAPCHPPTLTG